ncbi:MAG: MarR family winged helix-turn-helix transcriptional regulator [Paludibacteraceae bacterium]
MNENNLMEIDSISKDLMLIQPLLSIGFKEIRSQTNLNPGSLFILGLLDKYSVLTMTEIGCKLSIPKPHVTAQIDKLVEMNMVERSYDENDRRIINISLSEKGKKDIKQIYTIVSESLRRKISKLDEERLVIFKNAVIEVKNTLAEIMIDVK